MTPRMPELRVDDAVAAAFPQAELGVIRFEDLDNSAGGTVLSDARKRALAGVRERFGSIDEVAAHPALAAWRGAYRSFGTDPTKRRPAVEALVRRAVAGSEPASISPVVDAYLIAELEHLVPFGGYDADRLQGDVVLRFSPGDEPFVALGESEPSPTAAGELVYADEQRVLTRHWNHRDCEEAKITAASTRVVLVCEVLPWPEAPSAAECCERVTDLVREVCGGEAQIATVALEAPAGGAQ